MGSNLMSENCFDGDFDFGFVFGWL